MKIGIFDSGLGGLFITRQIMKQLPKYDIVYLGDTRRMPYGNHSSQTIYEYTRQCVDYLMQHGCGLVILACNTASAEALRKLQRQWLPRHYPRRRVLGIIVPTLEVIASKKSGRVGVIGTTRTINSRVYRRQMKKLYPKIKLTECATNLLAPMIEFGGTKWMKPVLKHELEPLLKKGTSTIVLGCTHYIAVKGIVRRLVGRNIQVVSQDEIIAPKLRHYLRRHPEIEQHLTRRGRRQFLLTETSPLIKSLCQRWFGEAIKPRVVSV